MRPTLILRRTPLIKFIGKRSHPSQVDHTPQPHPASPTHELPSSFADYRQSSQQHGPLGQKQPADAAPTVKGMGKAPSPAGGPSTYGAIGGKSARELGPIKVKDGEYFDVTELPKRFQKRVWTEPEMDAITSGGATMWG